MAIITRRTVMSLFSDPEDIYSHQIRIVLAEKDVHFELCQIKAKHIPEDLLILNPYGSIPTLVDRELVLYQTNLIMEYLDERFPHPPLMPVYPVARAEMRKMIYRIEQDWYSLVHTIQQGKSAIAANARKILLESLVSVAPAFTGKAFFISDEFTVLDCYVAPLLWRLPQLKITLPPSAAPLQEYMNRVFKRPSFQASLSDVERELEAA